MAFDPEKVRQRLDGTRRPVYSTGNGTGRNGEESRKPFYREIVAGGKVRVGKGAPVCFYLNHGSNRRIFGRLGEMITGEYTGENIPEGMTIVATSSSSISVNGETYQINKNERFYAQKESVEGV